MFNYLFTVDGRRISSIFDISKAHRVLIAGKEKYNMLPLRGLEPCQKKKTKEPENKGVTSAIKQACAFWFEQNSIDLDNNFKDVRCANKTTKMFKRKGNTSFKAPPDLDLSDVMTGKNVEESYMDMSQLLTDEDILIKLIEHTINQKAK